MDGYWKVYHQANTHELDSIVISLLAKLRRQTEEGKLVCICLIMVILGYTFRDIQNYVPKLKLPWDEPHPDHSTIHRAYQNIPRDYLDSLLEETSRKREGLRKLGE